MFGSNSFKTLVLCVTLLVIVLPSQLRGAQLRNGHCLGGCPVGEPTDNALIVRSIYSLSYNTQNKVADWAAYTVSPGSIGIASSLSRVSVEDGYISETLSVDDYAAAIDSDLVQGQLVPLVNFAGTPFWSDANYLTNAIAITQNLNRGAWYGLNWSIRNLVNKRGRVFVVSGPLFYEGEDKMTLDTSSKHKVPNAFFKIVITESGRLSAFVLDQSTPVHIHHCALLSSIEEIESLSNLVLFPQLDVASYQPLDEALGCS